MDTDKQTRSYSDIDHSENPQSWVELMASFANHPDVQFIRQMMINWIKEIKPSYLLDAGCGTGDSTRAIAKTLPSTTGIVGMDFSQQMIDYALAQTNPTNINFQQGDLTQLTYPTENFDVIRIERVLHHIENLAASFNECWRVLKPNGSLIIAEPDYTMFRLSPLELSLNYEYARKLGDSIANGDVGVRLRQLAVTHQFFVQKHKVINIVWDDFELADKTTQFIEMLRQVLKAHNRMEVMDQINTAVANGSYYLAIPMHVVHLQKL